MTSLRIEKLSREHDLTGFDCGEEPLNRFLAKFALVNQFANAAQTYLGLADNDIAGYYTLTVGDIEYSDAPERLTKGLARHPVPLMVLARLAIDKRWQGRGLGAALLKDAVAQTLIAAEIGGIRALAVEAKHKSARAFYEHFGFVSSPTDPLSLYILVSDLRRLPN